MKLKKLLSMPVVLCMALGQIPMTALAETEDPAEDAPVHEHSYTAEVTDASCTGEGYTVYTCECGDSYTDGYTDALGHDWLETSRSEAAEEEAGTVVYTCQRCGETKTEAIRDPDRKMNRNRLQKSCL